MGKPICKIKTRNTVDFKIEAYIDVIIGNVSVLQLDSHDLTNMLMARYCLDLTLGSEIEYINKLCLDVDENIRSSVCDEIYDFVNKRIKL